MSPSDQMSPSGRMMLSVNVDASRFIANRLPPWRMAAASRGELREGPAGGAEIMPGVALVREAWHVVERKQDRVRPAMQDTAGQGGAGIAVNDSAGLEREADAMGRCRSEPRP